MTDNIPTHQGQLGTQEENAAARSRSVGLLWGQRALGLAAALVVWLLMGTADGLSPDARNVAALATLMAIWWMTEAVPLAVTSLLPIVLVPAVTQSGVAETSAPYAHPIVFLFLGGFLIAIAMEKWNLHHRIALLTLRQVGVSPRRIVLGAMLASGFMSMWVSNTATTLMMLPIGLSLLTLVVTHAPGVDHKEVAARLHGGERINDVIDNPDIRRFGACLMLAIAWASSMGGLGTIIGSTPNAIVAGYAATELGRPIGFGEWLAVGLPLSLSFILIAWFLMTRFIYHFELREIPGGQQMIEDEIHTLGPLSQGEWMVLVVFVSAAFLWIVPGLMESLPGIGDVVGSIRFLNDTSIAIAAGVALFLLPGRGHKEMVLNWKDAEAGMPWGTLLLFGGGLSLASAVVSSGLDSWIGAQVTGLGVLPTVLLVAAIATLVLFLTEFTSNTATAATFIPILGGVAIGIDADAMTLLLPAAFAATCAFMLPIATPPNAIVFGSGVISIPQMMRGGIALNLVGIALITLFAYTLGAWALGLKF